MVAISPYGWSVTENRFTWQTIDHAMTRWSAILAVAAVAAAVLAANPYVQAAAVEGIAACVLLVVVLIAWASTSRLHQAKVVIDQTGIRREGRGGFNYPWDVVRTAGIGEGLMAGDAPYVIIATTRRSRHTSALAAAGSGFRRPSAAVPIDRPLVDQVERLLATKGVLRTAEQWSSTI